MAVFNLFNCFVQDVGRAVHNLHADTFKVLLTDTAPVATNTVKGNITEIAAGGGYTTGGLTLSVTSFTQNSGEAVWLIADKQIDASGGDIGPFRYAAIYNDTSALDSLVGWYDYGSEITITNGSSRTMDFDVTNGVITLGPL